MDQQQQFIAFEKSARRLGPAEKERGVATAVYKRLKAYTPTTLPTNIEMFSM